LQDSRDEWRGELKTKTSREALAKVDDTIETKPTNAELYQNALSQLEKDTFELADLYIVKPPIEKPKKRVTAPPVRSITPITIILVALCIIGFLLILNIIRRRK
jgi:hypothetical protein